ncbi:MAG: universal stress protein [Ktedonobacterales bacterium]|nr:universal stress protein [Ktedonobacterales bacterium]
MRILVPLDGSLLAERAIAPAAMLAHRSDTTASITLLWVDTLHQTQATVAEEFSADVAANVVDRTPQHLLYLARMRDLPALLQIDVSIQLVAGEPAPTIARVAGEQQFDLIVMASHVLTAFDAAMWGSVTETVARTSTVPTLIIRPEGPAFPDVAHVNPFSILVPLDETAFAEAALPGALLLAQAFRGEILLYHVIPPAAAQGHRDEAAYAYLDRIATRLAGSGVMVDRLLGHGNIATSIAALMLENRADVVAIATHGDDKFSIAENVLHHITAPMIVVHPTH